MIGVNGRGRRTWGLVLGVVFLFGAGAWSLLAATPAADPGTQVLRLTQRINGIVQHVLELEQAILVRIEKKRPIDWERMASRLASARRQIRSLRRVARHFEPQIPAGHPARAQVESLRSQLKHALVRHRELAARIVAGGGEACRHALSQIESVCQDPMLESIAGSFPVRSIDDQF
jgi:hypothetical protein